MCVRVWFLVCGEWHGFGVWSVLRCAMRQPENWHMATLVAPGAEPPRRIGLA